MRSGKLVGRKNHVFLDFTKQQVIFACLKRICRPAPGRAGAKKRKEFKEDIMAKKGPRNLVRMVSPDGDDCYYTEKNSRNTTEKLKLRKYNKKKRKHEEYTEGKMK